MLILCLKKESYSDILSDCHHSERKHKLNFIYGMSRRDDITGRGAMNGYRSSHANNKTKHLFQPNLQKKRFYFPEEDRWVTLKVSTKTLRTINKKGLAAVLKEAKANGTLLKEV